MNVYVQMLLNLLHVSLGRSQEEFGLMPLGNTDGTETHRWRQEAQTACRLEYLVSTRNETGRGD